MKTYTITILQADAENDITAALTQWQSSGRIRFSENHEAAEPVSEEQAQEMIDEAEIGPYYSEEEAKKILKI